MLNKKGTRWQRHIGTKDKKSPFEGGFRGMLAFTLIEVMITTAVLALLITGIYSIFKGSADSWTKGNVRMERYQNARAILEMMSRELSCAMVNEARKIYMLGTHNEPVEEYSTKDELFFIAPIHSTSGLETGQSDMLELGYFVENDTELMRNYSVGNINFTFEQGDYSHSLGIAVEDLRFYYYYDECDEADSSETWGSNDSNDSTYLYKLPKKIKIVLKTRDEEAREDTQTFETTVFIPGAE